MDLDDILVRLRDCERRAQELGLEQVWAHLNSASGAVERAKEELERDDWRSRICVCGHWKHLHRGVCHCGCVQFREQRR